MPTVDKYMTDAEERSVKNLRFHRVGARDLDDLKRDLETAAAHLGIEPQEVTPPPRGFLVEPLTSEQRKKINMLLAPRYAQENSMHQRDLRRIPIEECGQKMVPIIGALERAKIDYSVSKQPFHPACGNYAGKERIWYAREQVVDKLVTTLRAFNQINLRPQLEDCYRPPEVQEGLLFRRMVDVARKNFEWSPIEVRKISMSLTAPAPGIAGHQAGAALDMRLKNKDTDQLLDLGNDYPEANAISSIRCPYVTREQFITRMKFAHVMRMAGYRLLTTENWHASFGDKGMGIDGTVSHFKAIYGPIKSFDSETGEIVPYDLSEMGRNYLNPRQSQDLVRMARNRKSGAFSMTDIEVVNEFRALLSYQRKGIDISADSSSLDESSEGE